MERRRCGGASSGRGPAGADPSRNQGLAPAVKQTRPGPIPLVGRAADNAVKGLDAAAQETNDRQKKDGQVNPERQHRPWSFGFHVFARFG